MEEKNTNLFILGIVAVVAIVGIVSVFMYMKNTSSAETTETEGEIYTFDQGTDAGLASGQAMNTGAAGKWVCKRCPTGKCCVKVDGPIN